MMLARVIGISTAKYGVSRFVRMSTTPQAPNLDDIRDLLKKYPGGSVDLDLDSTSGIAVLSLNHVNKMNAMSGQMMVELTDRVTELESWSEGKAVIFTGAGNTFCSGGDLSTVRGIFDPENGNQMCYYMQNATTRFWNLPLLTFALIKGRALGGGAELATACDFRLMSSSAKLGFVQAKMGVTTGWGGGTRLVKLLGRTKSLSLLCSGQVLDAKTAQEIGLVDHVLEDVESELTDVKRLIASQYCSPDRSIVRAMKSVATAASDNNVCEALEIERNIFQTKWGGPLHVAAINNNVKHK
ncbi:ethylmalonyl-CoA decarboxylase-like [Haliotis rufescens]|uniref:ethylmalonyl-CoA decarboxylase-like n=1 Tax=Haliotis rufescens TaxID=6454 RepID=UPI00201EA104|nr:ethylmalonyl-CoA decarboxylase-like [Haliotis rufescens]XP_046328866.2 ethylmalonyl-CoA decarboxylase-like [Haliotis rufescens]